jgi:TolB-like protein
MSKDRSGNPIHIFFLLFVTFFILHTIGTNCLAAGETTPASVAFLPFTAHAAQDLTYLKDGIRDMLASRLSANAGIVVVDKAAIDKALAARYATTADKIVPPADLPRLGNDLGANYLVTGSITALGGGMSIDAKVIHIGDTATPYNFYATATSEDSVIPAINQLAADISAKIFHSPAPSRATATPIPVPAAPTAIETADTPYQTAHPERAFMGAVTEGGSQVMRPGGYGNIQDFTKSQNFEFAVQGMDVGDIDGDGIDDVVLASLTEVQVYHRNGNKFNPFGTITLSKNNRIHCISLADLNSNGRDEIYISAHDQTGPNSFAVEWQENDFAFLIKNTPWYIKAVNLPGQGMILAGQRAGQTKALDTRVYQLNFDPEGKLKKGQRLPLPKDANVFNFVFADIDGDGSEEIILIDDRDHLNVLRVGGKPLWRSSGLFGGSNRAIGKDFPIENPEPEINALRPKKYENIFVPARIIAVDLNHDGLMDVVVNRNQLRWSTVFPNLKSYTAGHILGLTWNGISMTELWYTKKVDGYLSDYQFKTASDDADRGQLYVSLVLPTGVTLSSARDSTVLMYEVHADK